MRSLIILTSLTLLCGCVPLIVATDGESVTVRTNAEPISPADRIAYDYCNDMKQHAEFNHLNPDGTATYFCRAGVWPRQYFDPRLN
jgi:hypothetical protein